MMQSTRNIAESLSSAPLAAPAVAGLLAGRAPSWYPQPLPLISALMPAWPASSKLSPMTDDEIDLW